MRLSTLAALALAAAMPGLAATCLPGTLQDYINLGAGGCSIGPALFANFYTTPGQTGATPIDPASIAVVPGGTASLQSLQFGIGMTAGSGQLLESFFHFDVSAPQFFLASMTLGAGSTAADDGVAAATADLCPDASFAPTEPTGCINPPRSLVTLATSFFEMRSDTTRFTSPSFFDVFVDLSIDGGLSGSAFLDSATFSVAVPEPATIPLAGLGLAALASLRIRSSRKNF